MAPGGASRKFGGFGRKFQEGGPDWTFPPMMRFSPPFVHALSLSLEGTDQTNPTVWALQNWFCRAHSILRFPTQNRMIRFPPNCRSQFWKFGHPRLVFAASNTLDFAIPKRSDLQFHYVIFLRNPCRWDLQVAIWKCSDLRLRFFFWDAKPKSQVLRLRLHISTASQKSVRFPTHS